MRLTILLGLLLLCTLALQPQANRPLQGVIDVHVHSLPDSEPWTMDGIEVAKLAKAKGMRGLVLKSHWEPTAMLAYLARKEAPGLEVFGGICLSRAVGGINPAAVEEMVKVTGGWGRVVWMPTVDAENVRRTTKSSLPFVSVSRNGQLLPEVKEVLALIAKNKLVLATGHSSPEEDLMLVREGRRLGVEHMVITHPMSASVKMNVAQMQEAAKAGAFLEMVYVPTLSNANRKALFSVADVADTIRKVGVESVVLSTDMGQIGLAPPPDGMAAYIAELKAKGFTQRELDRMTKENPARLLGLPAL
ncbi:MAG: hypothetical protein EXQ47_04510 [Bryobacterales bacterium]|nr:hypothetical protein [Bryobacterales bacterium]